MKIAVLVEPLPGKGYRAKGGEPFPFTVEGKTRHEALRKLEDLIREKLCDGSEIFPLEIPAQEHPMARWAGSLDPEEPMVQEWLEIMAENRRKMDAEEDPDLS